MLKIVINFALLAAIFGFAIFCGDINTIGVFAIFLFFTAVLSSEIFNYIFFYKLALTQGLFKPDSFLAALFSRRLIPAVISSISGTALALCFILNLLTITPFEFLFITIILVVLFLMVRFVGFRILKSEFKNLFLGSKKWMIFITAAFGAILWGILILVFEKNDPINTPFFDFLSSQTIAQSFKSALLNEIYAYASYINFAAQWIKGSVFSSHSLALFVIIALNKLIFFTACLHFISFVFSFDGVKSAVKNSGQKSVKFGYFLTTIFSLCYITFALYTSSNLVRNLEKKDTSKTEQIVKFILKSGVKFDLNSSDAQEILAKLSQAKELNLAKIKAQSNSYIDEVYDRGARGVAQKVADWSYLAVFDYLVLWHKVFGDGLDKYTQDEFREFIDESFDNKLNEKLRAMVLDGLSEYEKDIKNIFGVYLDDDLSINIDITSDFIQNDRLTRLGISGAGAVGITGVLMAKMAGKTAAKTTAKLAASGTSGASGAICGAAAVVCVPIFAVATWFGFDYVVAKGDEFLNRDELEDKIYSDFMASKEEFKRAFNSELELIFNQISDEVFKNE